jgi:hypothetical protein
MRFRCHFDYYPQPCEPCLYIRPMVVDVVCFTDSGDEVIAGRLAVDHLDLDRTEVEGEDVYEICDSDSAGWERVHTALFEPEGAYADLRREFNFHEAVSHVLFLHKSVFHPALRDWQSFIIDHVATLFGHESALVMWKKQTDLTDSELADLGFRIVAGHDLLFRPNMYKHKYSALDDDRNTLNLEVASDTEQYVEQKWNKEARG